MENIHLSQSQFGPSWQRDHLLNQYVRLFVQALCNLNLLFELSTTGCEADTMCYCASGKLGSVCFLALHMMLPITVCLQVDTGLQILPGTDGETATQGLDGLGDRCKAYYKQVRSHCLVSGDIRWLSLRATSGSK